VEQTLTLTPEQVAFLKQALDQLHQGARYATYSEVLGLPLPDVEEDMLSVEERLERIARDIQDMLGA
jgi:hypothetical protein